MAHTKQKLLLAISAGFALLWADIALGHVSAGLKHPAMWLPLLLLAPAAVVCGLTAVQATPARQRLLSLVCYLAVLMGGLGVVFHLLRFLRDLRGAIQWEVVLRLMRYPPLFAPLGVTGLGIFGLLARDVPPEGPTTGGN